MSTFTCPQGHQSSADDYCDTCGMPIGAAAAEGAEAAGAGSTSQAAPAQGPGPSQGSPSGATSSAASGVSPAATPVTQECPNCGSDNSATALFCEACGYDFTTGTMPRPPDAGQSGSADGGQPTGTKASPGKATAAPPTAPTSATKAAGVTWVVEMWVDPEWYESQESEEPCPSPGLPVVTALKADSVLIGRPSVSRNIHPQIDCASDVGVSRRQSQLTSDGQRWWVEDLQSSNGTYVGPASGPLPSTPVPPGQRRELGPDDRIYVGAWTRLVVRRATPEESAGQV